MKIAVIGSRNIIDVDLKRFLPCGVSEIVSGGARGVDSCAREYAIKNKIKYKEFLPDYSRYGKVAPLKRNIEIIEYADEVLAFWDGKSRGTAFVIENCKRKGKAIKVYIKK